MLKVTFVAVMGFLTPSVGAAQTPPASPVIAADPFAVFVEEAARRFAVPVLWVRLVMRAESAGDPAAVSPKGAIGLMQIMPTTYARLSQTYGLGPDPLQPRDNILAGAAYLREMYDRYGSPGFLAAYNAGPGRYESHLATGLPLPGETRIYLAKLAPMVEGVQTERTLSAPDPLAWKHAPLFIARNSDDGRSSVASGASAGSGAGDQRSSPTPAVPFDIDVTALAPQSNGVFGRRTPPGRPQ